MSSLFPHKAIQSSLALTLVNAGRGGNHHPLSENPDFSTTYMANILQDKHSIRNIQVVSSNRVHSTHSFEVNKCRIFKPFFRLSDKTCLMFIIKKNEEDKS